MYGLNHWSSTQAGWRGPLLFSTVQISHFQVEVAQTKWHDATATMMRGMMQQQRWHCGLGLKGQSCNSRWTHGAVQVALATGT